jgi:phosphoribosyl-ATP pyrophosphohydrolase
VTAGVLLTRMAKFTLHDLEKRVAARAKEGADASYTRSLLDQGVDVCAKKLGEEALETALAAVGESKQRVVAETADLLYHLLVLLKARGVALKDVESALAKRTGQSGLAEKAARKSRPKQRR